MVLYICRYAEKKDFIEAPSGCKCILIVDKAESAKAQVALSYSRSSLNDFQAMCNFGRDVGRRSSVLSHQGMIFMPSVASEEMLDGGA